MITNHNIPPNTTIDDLDTDYKALALLFKTPDEEAHVFDFWIEHNYDTDAAVRELHRYRLRIRQRAIRRRRAPKHPSDDAAEVRFEEACEPGDLVPGLTERQVSVVRLRAEGHTQEEIGDLLGCSEWTVRSEIDKIQRKYYAHHGTE